MKYQLAFGSGNPGRARGTKGVKVRPDTTLAAIAQHRPASSAELSTISGVGAKKLESYGEAVLAVVAGGAADDA